jgi:unsaturated rhamnogalacturonyl hydrolase
MGYYFEDDLSMAHRAQGSVETTLSVIAQRFVGLNPRAPLTYRTFCRRGLQRGPDYRYHADFTGIFPAAEDEQCVYAWAKMWSPRTTEMMFDLNCRGPLELYLNGDRAWRSDIFSERYPDKRNRLTLKLREGWNQFVIRAKKTRGGFGWIFGSWLGKHPYVFMMPSAEREGQEGWLYSDPVAKDLPVEPRLGQSERHGATRWHPAADWPATEAARGVFARIFGVEEEVRGALAWTQVEVVGETPVEARLEGSFEGAIRVLVDGAEVFAAKESGSFGGSFALTPGTRDVQVIGAGSGPRWGFDLSLEGPDGPLATRCPCQLEGSDARWLHAGPFGAEGPADPAVPRDFLRLHETTAGPGYWRLDAPDTWLRIYNENPYFGRWNYPLGVTIYGLLHAGRILESEEIQAYVGDHVQVCCSTFPYAQWDHTQFGGPTHVHRLLTGIDSLDDCGSFGSCLLEVAKYCQLEGFRPIADFVADFIARQQDRFPDGAFYRREMMHAFHENTMWADDLYMSVPFLCRYYQLTGESAYIDDAANQFVGFRKRLYMPDQRLMSHVYDLRREMATGVPWGRGNGWTLFSLSELLEVLPVDHPRREELLEFFRELCAGILQWQDADGMWHQVLSHPDAYPETSCTAMFIYAYSRGIRNGWLEAPQAYADAVFKAWEAINRISIDREGNIYGVCRGSEFSFTPDYYKHELLWNLNDTHGIGIVLLAGVEAKKLLSHLEGAREPGLHRPEKLHA